MAWTLEKTSLRGGIYHGVLAHKGRAKVPVPELVAEHRVREIPLAMAPIEGTANQYQVTVDLPASLITDGVQIVSIRPKQGETPLASFAVIAGDGVPDDLATEVALLRAEVEMLKRAFRREARGRD